MKPIVRMSALLLGFFIVMPVQALLINVQSDGLARDLQCPVVKRASTASRSTKVAPVQDVFEPPAPDELEELPLLLDEDAARALLQGDVLAPGRAVAVAFWGDSHLAANFFGAELARLSGLPEQKVLPTFIPTTMGRSGVRLPIRKHCLGNGWSSRLAYLAREGEGMFSRGLTRLESSTPDSYLWIDFRLSATEPALRGVDVHYLPLAQGKRTLVGLRVDDGTEQIIELDAEGTGVLQLRADQAMSVIRLRLLEGSLSLEGFVPLYLESAPGMFLDTFGIPGATVQGWARLDPEYFRMRLEGFQYDVVVLQYGTNEGNRRPFDATAYRAELRTGLENLRQVFPHARCVLMGPTDRGVLVKRPKPVKGKKTKRATKPPAHELLKFARVHQEIGQIQRSLGEEYACSFWNWQEAMGGPGAAYKWFYRSPRLMSKDLIHLSVPGYQLSARKFAQSVGFPEWISTENPAP